MERTELEIGRVVITIVQVEQGTSKLGEIKGNTTVRDIVKE